MKVMRQYRRRTAWLALALVSGLPNLAFASVQIVIELSWSVNVAGCDIGFIQCQSPSGLFDSVTCFGVGSANVSVPFPAWVLLPCALVVFSIVTAAGMKLWRICEKKWFALDPSA